MRPGVAASTSPPSPVLTGTALPVQGQRRSLRCSTAAGRCFRNGCASVVTIRRAVGIAPDDVVGGVDGAVVVEIAGHLGTVFETKTPDVPSVKLAEKAS